MSISVGPEVRWVSQWQLDVRQLDEEILAVRRRLNVLRQGQLMPSDNDTDLGILGFGLFMVRDSDKNTFYATRCGAFHFDINGHLVTTNGFRVQGFANSGSVIPSDIQIKTNGSLSAQIIITRVSWEGEITVELSDEPVATPSVPPLLPPLLTEKY
jgi:flagellar hook protein FlgE